MTSIVSATDYDPLGDGSLSVAARIRDLGTAIDTVDTVVDENKALLEHGTNGLAAIKGAVDTVDTVVDDSKALLEDGTDGLAAIKTAVETVDTVVDANKALLEDGSEGLAAIKDAIDTVDTVVDANKVLLEDGTSGLAAIRGAVDTIDTVLDENNALLESGTHGMAAIASGIDNLPDNVWTRAIEGPLTAEQVMRLILAPVAAKISIDENNRIRVRNITDSKDRLVIEANEDGERTSVTIDGT